MFVRSRFGVVVAAPPRECYDLHLHVPRKITILSQVQANPRRIPWRTRDEDATTMSKS